MTIKTISQSIVTVAISGALLTAPALVFGVDHPACVYPHSDSDGDGYGWENHRTCVTSAGGGGKTRPICVFGDETDPDDDGWGWENGMSCLVADDEFDEDDDEENEDEEEFDEARLYFELNDTDGDLGFHGLIDRDGWVHLEIDNATGQEIFDLKLDGQLKTQQLTELFFESTEPTFDNLDPTTFFNRFPEGQYQVEAELGDGGELSSEATVTHLIPAPPTNIAVNGLPLSVGCESDIPAVNEPVTVSWDPVTQSHPFLGRTGEPITLVRYEFVIEIEDVDNVGYQQLLPAGQTSVEVPSLSHNGSTLIKVGVLAREENDNQTATEGCFLLN